MAQQLEIFVTNDDGIHAYGLKVLSRQLSRLGHVKIVAPRVEQSSIGTALTVRTPLYLQSVEWEDGVEAWTVTGTPCDCVKIGLNTLYREKKPDLIISGINAGSNAGRNVFHSGTVAAAILGAVKEIPSIAFSSCGYDKKHFDMSAEIVEPVVRYFQENTLPICHLLNVNVPSCEREALKGIKLAAQGKGHHSDNPEERKHPEGYSYYWLGNSIAQFEEDEDSDIYLLEQEYATIVPLDISNLTAKIFLEKHSTKFAQWLKTTTELSSNYLQ